MASTTPTPIAPTPADLRALVARRRIVLYRLAAVLSISPSRLSAMLNERTTLPADLAVRIARTIVEAD